MRRWCGILLLLLLPFQFSWAAVAGYCQHERDVTPQHIGHHEHAHEAPATLDVAADTQGDERSSATGVDADCAYCHLSAAKVFWSTHQAQLAAPAETHSGVIATAVESLLLETIERPNWRRA